LNRKEHMNAKEWILCIIVYAVVCALAAWLFYDSYIPVPVLALFFPLFVKAVKKSKGRRRTEELTEGFLKALMSVSASLSAGISPENAFMAAGADMEKLYGRRSEIVKELALINSRVKTGRRLGEVLKEFAKRVSIPEIYDFSIVFGVAGENGSDFSTVIGTCVNIMETKRQTESDARLTLRSKQYEQRVMCIIPPGIIAYLKLSSGGFIGVLYHNVFGIIVMTCCLAIYVLAIYLSEKIGDIAV